MEVRTPPEKKGFLAMKNNVYYIQQAQAASQSGLRGAQMLRRIAWLAVAVGIFLFVWNVNDFNSENLGLMISIGCLIAGMNIFLLSTVFSLLHTEPGKQ
jgi:hypothetical protein